MNIDLHANATTTPAQRKYIQESDKTIKELAEELGVTETTVQRWKNRDHVHDRSSQPHNLQTTLTEFQESIVVELRKTLLLPVDDLLQVVHEFIHPEVSRSSIIRLLRRYELTPLREMIPKGDSEDEPPKSFKDYLPGYLHADVKYLPQMPDEESRKYLFVAIDRATRWVYLEIFPDKTAQSAKQFLDHLVEVCPLQIEIVLTDNGKEFTDRFTRGGEREPTGNHPFDQKCQEYEIDHRLIKPGRPETNGMVEYFNQRIEKILKSTRFRTSKELKRTLYQYRDTYNHYLDFRSIGHMTPIEKMQEYYQSDPECFIFDPHNLPTPNT
jgi:transposase-like protein